MKKRFIIAVAAATALVFGTPALASATEVCEPSEAWTETIVISPEIPAVGEPTITVDHPAETVDHPAETVDHPAETVDHPAETIDHPAVTQTQWKYVKHGGHGFVWLDNNDQPKVKIDDHWYQRTSHTQVITISEAWTEVITEAWTEVITEAWTEVITEAWTEVISEAWTETIPNPDYVPAVPAVTETVEHEAVTCPIPEVPVIVVPPSIPDVQAPAPTPPVAVNTATEEESLAVTGSNDAVLPIGALALAAIVAGGTMIARRVRRN